MTPFPPFDGSAPKQQKFSAPPEMGIDPSKRYSATMETSMGSLVIALDPYSAPKAVNNFVFLALHHYYDDLTFHRIINTFVCQGGDPLGNGRGGPGYEFDVELPRRMPYEIGDLAMANRGDRHSNGSQFFLVSGIEGVLKLQPFYSRLGRVVKGLDVLDAMQRVPVSTDPATKDRPLTDVVIKSVTITVAD